MGRKVLVAIATTHIVVVVRIALRNRKKTNRKKSKDNITSSNKSSNDNRLSSQTP